MDAHARLDVFRELADQYERQGQPPMRDRFLVLAADAALAAGLTAEAEQLRQRLLQANPHHLLKPYGSFAQALQATDVQAYVEDLRQNYPLETAESLLRTLRENGRPAPLERNATPPPPKSAEQATIIPFQEEQPRAQPASAVPRTAARRDAAPRNRPASAIPLPRPEAPVPALRLPAAAPTVPLAPTPAPPHAVVPAAAEGVGGGAWLGSVLFGLVVTAGVVLAAYTLARPFVPAGWIH
jgi:hypothetical protein